MSFVVSMKEMVHPGDNPSVSTLLQRVEMDCRLSPISQVGNAGLSHNSSKMRNFKVK